MIKKKKPKSILHLLFILLGLVIVGLFAYFYLGQPEKGPGEKKIEETRTPDRTVLSGQKENMPRTKMEPPLTSVEKGPALTEEVMVAGPADQEDPCRDIENDVQDYFTYLNNQAYVKAPEIAAHTYDSFKIMVGKLSSQPPAPAGEGENAMTMAKNIYHFYRVLDENENQLIKQILKNESDSLETNLETFSKWLNLQCPDHEEVRPSLDVLYSYAGFFLNSIGGRAYLFRRAPRVRLLISYYAVLIIHESDKRGKNTYGIDIFPVISQLAKEISLYPDLQLQNTYIQQLSELQNYYLEKR